MSRPTISSPKDVRKIVRSIFQAIVLIILLILIIRALFVFTTYKPYDEAQAASEDAGFIAISYFGVERDGDRFLISTEQLEKHLKALYDQGYVTITQQDVLDYYQKGKLLPEKSLFLMFEDGRRDTSIFAENIMEKYNFKATMMSYGEKFNNSESKFLTGKDLKELEETTFWELGTNGYRLSYINVFDRYDNYIGELSNLEYSQISSYLGRNYNHYLMDFIRDEDSIPKESKSQMETRIRADYDLMDEIYTSDVGYLPKTYVLMHANTGAFGNNDKVSAVNKECIEELFSMNFNREGYSLNNAESSLYDLTRMQPQPYWSTNHLLMRIKDDTEKDVEFVTGKSSKKEFWDLKKGAAEYTDEKIIITCESESEGLIKLAEKISEKDYYFHVSLTGNKLGEQTVYVRADEELNTYLALKIRNNVLFVSQKTGSEEEILFEVDLDEVDAVEKVSVEEDEKEALIATNETLSTYSSNQVQKDKYEEARKEAEEMYTESVDDGAEEYVKDIELNEPGSRDLKFNLEGDKLSVWIDGKKILSEQNVDITDAGEIFLKSAWGGDSFSQRNLADDVYDGVFEKLYISSDENGKQVVFDQRFQGFDKFKQSVTGVWDSIVNWFIKYL